MSSTGSGDLAERYEQALGAAERALSEGLSWVRAEQGRPRVLAPVRELRQSLRAVTKEQPNALSSRFERYIEAIMTDSGYRVDVARAELDAGFDQAAQALLEVGILAPANYRDACQTLDRSARGATTMNELVTVYRRMVADLVAMAERPVESAQHRGLRRALSFITEHLNEQFSLSQVARAAGFAPSYFSALFKRREGTTFERYVLQLRIERAKELLASTDLSAERVAQLSGFRLRHYFHRVFREAMHVTPLQYRQSRNRSRRRAAPPPKARRR
jgi:YesN/AraC family two-component response regulator